jgi:hypothetical protein
MTSVIKHALRASATTSGGYRPEGWCPRIQVALRGPSPAGAELEWTVARPDGSPWFRHRAPVAELGETQATTIDLRMPSDGDDLDESGTIAFTLRLVSELDGVDEVLHDGSLSVIPLDGEHRYAVDNDWMLGLGLLCLDTVDEHDAPSLRATVYLKGDVDAYQLEAHCFIDGKRFATASLIESHHTFTANDASVVAKEFVAVFDDVRGWNNLSGSGWGEGWHLLDAHDGQYEVKLLQNARLTRRVAFAVAGGRIVASSVVESDPWGGHVVFADALSAGEDEGRSASRASAFYGDPATAAVWSDIDDVYALRIDHRPEAAQPTCVDDDTAAALQTFFDRAERLITTWETDMVGTPPPFDYGQVLSAEGVLAEKPGYEGLRDAAASVADSQPVELYGAVTTVGALRKRMGAIFAAADARLNGAAQAENDTLAPYRDLLRGDKLAVFDEHPADSFQYLATDGQVLETPDALAEAEYWYFEGALDLPSTATVEGVEIKTAVQGWRVLGWRFDADGAILDEFERQGYGSRAPKTAFQHER